MKKIFFLLIFIIISTSLFPEEILQNYIQVYGEGPIGQYLIGFDKLTYSKEDAVEYAKSEIMEFLSAMVYGYKFTYKVENKTDSSEGYFDILPIAQLKFSEKLIRLTQLQENENELKLQAIYRLTEDQKTYIKGFQSSLATMSIGEAKESWLAKWDKRLKIYKEALKNCVLNDAKSRYKSRPLYIKGKILLIDSPKVIVVSGEWVIRVKAHILIEEVSYRDIY